MAWYVLRKRRHVGPFSESQLRKLLADKKISTQDYILSKENADTGIVAYVTVAQQFKVESSNSKSSASRRNPNEAPDILPTSSFAVPGDELTKGGYTLTNFSKEEVTKLFEDQVDPVVLAQANQLRSEEKSVAQKDLESSHKNSAGMKAMLDNLSQKFSFRAEWADPKNVAALATVVVVLGMGIWWWSQQDGTGQVAGGLQTKDKRAADLEAGAEGTAESRGRSVGSESSSSGFRSEGGGAYVGEGGGPRMRVPDLKERSIQPPLEAVDGGSPDGGYEETSGEAYSSDMVDGSRENGTEVDSVATEGGAEPREKPRKRRQRKMDGDGDGPSPASDENAESESGNSENSEDAYDSTDGDEESEE